MGDDLLQGRSRHARWAGLSATCAQRTINEDALGVFEEAEVFVVADGCGGVGSGRRAAEITVSCFGDHGGAAAGLTERGAPYRESAPPQSPLIGPPADALAWAVVAANQLVLNDATRDPRYRGMGCAVAALRLQPSWLALTHVGDCRVGRLRGGDFRWLTEDHTLWVELQRAGAPAEEVQRVMQEHSTVITRAIGAQEPIQVELQYCPLLPGDLLLLCTDGLWRQVGQEAIAEVLRRDHSALLDQCRALLAAVEAAGGHDNTTILLVEVVL